MMRGVYCDGSKVGLKRGLPIPSPMEGEELIRIRTVGICDTDLQLAQGYMNFRGILGHEFLGKDADGRRVTGEINNPCLKCPTCLAGRPRHCPHRTVLGILNHDGAMADWAAVPSANLHGVPDAIDDAAGVFIEPLAAAFRMAEQVKLNPGVSIAVLGDGKLGILCAWVARLSGAQVHLIGKHADKLKLAGPSIETHLLESIDQLSKTFDVVADCTGSVTGFPTAMKLVRPCGTVILKTTVAGHYLVDLSPIVIDEIMIVGSRCGEFPRAIEALEKREIDVKPLIGGVFSLDKADEAFDNASRKGSKKIIIEVD